MRCIKILSPLNEKDNNSNLREITFQNFRKLVEIKLGLETSFDRYYIYI